MCQRRSAIRTGCISRSINEGGLVIPNCLSKLADVLLDATKIEADHCSKLLNIAVGEFGEAHVWNGAHAEHRGKLLALLNVALDESDLWILGSKLWKLSNEPLARSTPWSEEIEHAKAAGSLNLLLKVLVGVCSHDLEVSWCV